MIILQSLCERLKSSGKYEKFPTSRLPESRELVRSMGKRIYTYFFSGSAAPQADVGAGSAAPHAEAGTVLGSAAPQADAGAVLGSFEPKIPNFTVCTSIFITKVSPCIYIVKAYQWLHKYAQIYYLVTFL